MRDRENIENCESCKMAFVGDDSGDIPDDSTAYVDTWDTAQQLEVDEHFCPLCEIPETFTTASGNKPIAQLHKVIADVQIENKLSPAGFVRFVGKYYNEKTRPVLVNVLSWQKKKEEKINHPVWSIPQIYAHFSAHVADNWLARQEALRQTTIILQRTANTCLTKDGPPNPNTVKTFIELQKLQKMLRVPEPMGCNLKERDI